MPYASTREIAAGVADMVRPARRVQVSESAQANLRIVNPSGSAGNWSADVTTYMCEPMNLVRSRLYEAIVFVGPARSGKTIALVDGVLAYSIVDDPADTLIIQTNQGQAEDFSKTRISRAISGSPELARRLSPRAHDDNVLLKFFRNGMAVRFGWPTLAQLSGKDLRRVLMTDVDNITGDLSIDECFGLALKRTQTYMSAGICVAESSPARDFVDPKWRPKTPHEAPPAPGILSLYNRGDRRRWYWPCVECKKYFEAAPGIDGFALPQIEELVERVQVEDIVALSERHSLLHCPNCGVGISQKHKRAMNRAGRWAADGQSVEMDGSVSGERPRSRTASFWLGGVAAAYQPWVSLVERYLQAVKAYASTGESKPLKTTTNVDQAMPFTPIASRQERNDHELSARAEDWQQGTVPHGVRFLTGSIDIQAGKRSSFVIQVMGWGEGQQSWIIDRYALKSSRRETGELLDDGSPKYHTIDPASFVEDWDRLIEKVIERKYPLADGSGRMMPIRMTTCDSGGKAGVTQRAYGFWRALRARGLAHRFRLVKGAAHDGAPRLIESFPDVRGKSQSESGAAGDVPVLMINTTIIKDAVIANVWRDVPGPGFCHFAKWLSSRFYEELTAETRGPKRWENRSGRPNETFDLMVYAYAALLKIGGDKINWAMPPSWAAPWDSNPDLLPGASLQVQKPRPRGPAVRSSGVSVY